MQSKLFSKATTVTLVLAFAAAALSFALWQAGFLTPLQYAFVFLGRTRGIHLNVLGFKTVIVSILGISVAAAVATQSLGMRRAFPFLGIGFLTLAAVSQLGSWFFLLDIQFTPIALSALLSASAVQLSRLWRTNAQLREKLIASSSQNPKSLINSDPKARLVSGLKLLDTVLSLNEAIVFQQDSIDGLIPAARIRSADTGPLDPSRNSTWREGVSLCERAMRENEVIVDDSPVDSASATVAVPLQHEARMVGALLVRLRAPFQDDDRSLLTAVGAQIARDLQRQEAARVAGERGLLDFFSTRASERQLESVFVLNGLLAEQHFGLEALAEISDGMAIAYLDGTLAYVNGPLLKLAQLTKGEADQLNLFGLLDCFRTEVFDEPAMAVRRVLQKGEPYERELSFTERGATLGFRISLVCDAVSPANAQSQPLCIAVTVRDLTRVKEYEQLKSDMISLMSHELRTPLTSINGFAELLVAEENLPEQVKEFVTIIASESQRLSRMINTFLAVTKLERKDKQEVMKIPLRLDEVVREIITTLQPVAKKRRIRLIEQPAQRLPPVAADKNLISQAVKNLVSNAIKYSPERTTVTVTTKLEAEAVRVCVEDRGYGIPLEARDKVWEKFYRVVREGQEKDEESTGLGLSFVREVVEQHGGTVGLDSEEGRGSKFSFTLPRL